MANFMKLDDGRYINLDLVASIQYDAKRHGTRIVFKDDEARPAIETWGYLRPNINSVVPAQAGYYLLLCFDAQLDQPPRFERVPIVAWECSPDGIMRPLTYSEDSIEAEADYTVLSPDGQVISPFDPIYDNEAAWRKFKFESWERRKAAAIKKVKTDAA
jgi:hypothetical protein